MYLHGDRETFRDLILQVADKNGRTPIVVEKDYYVTLILRLLSEKLDQCVFKGVTSLLSKGFHVIDRFSEDIDITFDEHIGESRRKKLKNVVLKGISDYLAERQREDLVEKFSLGRFSMKLQSLERTYIDKVFALCDYFMQGRAKRCSRHLYDIYKLSPLIKFDEEFAKLVGEVREHRAQMSICPSAMPGVNVPDIITQFCDKAFYEDDYQSITSYFAADFVPYEDTITKMREIAAGSLFVEA